ncbi:hypothetical protein K488DRAFT_79220 [Vararia minispora EC-137]|uniref:Uncharacterized protein n=1 Tax=Vararia minispora EC-137 TaxID=1314806 RepID=A0ACB8QHN0_9AGAM|nr:hypothetical protein K488DRAFT_79220 [Vararia minispora EC-137]
MCAGSSPTLPRASHPAGVRESLVAGPLPDGYWAQDFPFSNKTAEYPDIIAYGLGFQGAPSTIRLFVNPSNQPKRTGWKVSEIASLEFPVGMTFADLTGDGFNDVIICDRYGPNMNDLWDAQAHDGGRVQWLKNPGERTQTPFWEAKRIGNSTGMHRLVLFAGHFTRHDVVQIMGLPIIARSGDFNSPAPVIIFTPRYGLDKSKGPISWETSTVFDSQFRMIHDVRLLPRSNGDLDMVVVSGREGIVLLWFDHDNHTWQFNVVGQGLQPPSGQPHSEGFFGSGSVDICHVGDDDVGYIATCEAFHGHVVSVYTKTKSAPKGPSSLKSSSYWTRRVVDDYGPLDNESHTGPLHHVAAVPLAGYETMAFAVACMGVLGRRDTGSGDSIRLPDYFSTASKQGVYLYSPADLANGKFTKIRITGESAGRLAVASYSPDVASLSYYVPGYFTGPDPPQLRINGIGDRASLFWGEKLENEVLLRIPRPSAVPKGDVPTLPFWSLAGKTLVLKVLAPGYSATLEQDIVAVKVIYGKRCEIEIKGKDGSLTRGISPPAKEVGQTRVTLGATVTASRKTGAVFVAVSQIKDAFQGPFTAMSQIFSSSAMPHTDTISQDAASSTFPFVRVDQLAWANGNFDDFEFYNALGFHLYFNDDRMEKLAHIQAWTLGIGETETGRSFCEIHYCLNNGGGSAGMRYFADNYTGEIDLKKELTKEWVNEHSTLIVVPDLCEHGPLWKIQQGTKAAPKLLPNAAVDYPYHAWLSSDFGKYTIPIKPSLGSDKQKFDVWLAFEFPSEAFQPEE